ncbi:MAG: response regulator transcription factor [Magnetococcales bacterium]|nr:response regulator transcription factor [Magnetococcales bacterium]
MRILIIEDDQVLANQLKRKLEAAHFAVDMVYNGSDGEAMGNETAYHAVVLDLGLPGQSGLTILKNWRKNNNIVPVIILTARNTWQERVQGIDAGADDYLGKPFHVEELVARLKAITHRYSARSQGKWRVGGFCLDEERQCITKEDGETVALTAMEFRLMRVFMLAPTRIHSKESLLEALYDLDKEVDHNIIEVYINHLRKKLGKESFRTLRWQGYLFAPGEGE